MGTLLFFAIAGVDLQLPQGYRLPNLPVAVPHALPTVGDVMGPTRDLHTLGTPIILAAVALILALIPILAYAEAGFLGVLRAVYLDPHDPLAEGRHADAWSRIREAFAASGRAHFVPFLALRAVQAALALATLLVPLAVPAVSSYALGVLAVDVLLLYAPYAVVESKRGAVAAVRESVQLVADHLPTTLVALLFGLLATGGMSILLSPLGVYFGYYGPILASAFYAPIGTVLSLYLYKVYLGFRPRDVVAEPAPAPATVPVGA